MTKRPDSDLPRRQSGKALDDAQAKEVRCTATEGAQQCLKEQHDRFQNHTWGQRGETPQWAADGHLKTHDAKFVPAPTQHRHGPFPDDHPGGDQRHGHEIGEDGADWPVKTSATDDTLVQGNAAVLAAAASPRGGQEADPTPTPSGGSPLEPTDAAPHGELAGSGTGSGRPTSGRSIGTKLANTAVDTALGVPTNLQDEISDGREATELLLKAAADHWRWGRPMPADKLLDLEGIVLHMIKARGLK